MRIVLGIVFIITGISVLLWLGANPQPVPKPGMPVCKIIIPYGYLQAGWKIRDPAEDGNIANLKAQGKAEITELPGQVECTRYGVNETPVTTPSALAMWRKL